MKRIKCFLCEISEDFKLKNNLFINALLILFIGLLLVKLVDVMFEFSILKWVKTLPFLFPLYNYVLNVIKNGGDLGMFYIFAFAGIVFMPIPVEALYFSYLKTDIYVPKLLLISTVGVFIAQLFNYFLGRFLGDLLSPLLGKKEVIRFKQRLFKFEWIAIIFMHALPLPFQSFNFITGMFKYDFKKFCLFSMIGCILKGLLLVIFFFKFV
ncbi:VTT domain-containing protein [Candidatus Woesearchaeota archaeon]|nr:VTT domain-containing protein [Candidatus Woesearchaeota archaeon]